MLQDVFRQVKVYPLLQQVLRQDLRVVNRQEFDERPRREGQIVLHRQVVHLAYDLVGVQRRAVRLVLQLYHLDWNSVLPPQTRAAPAVARVPVALHAVHHVVGVQRFSVRPLHALPQVEGEGRALLVGLPAFRQVAHDRLSDPRYQTAQPGCITASRRSRWTGMTTPAGPSPWCRRKPTSAPTRRAVEDHWEPEWAACGPPQWAPACWSAEWSPMAAAWPSAVLWSRWAGSAAGQPVAAGRRLPAVAGRRRPARPAVPGPQEPPQGPPALRPRRRRSLRPAWQ